MGPLRLTAGSWLLFSLLGASIACGGTVEGVDEAPPGEDDAPAQSAGGRQNDGSDVGDAGDLTLEECKLGSPSETTASCNWLAEDRCYETKAKACDCVCPRDEPSVCSSDFYGGEGSRTKVRCF